MNKGRNIYQQCEWHGYTPIPSKCRIKLQLEIVGKEINLTAPDPGNISQVKDSKNKARKDQPLI